MTLLQTFRPLATLGFSGLTGLAALGPLGCGGEHFSTANNSEPNGPTGGIGSATGHSTTGDDAGAGEGGTGGMGGIDGSAGGSLAAGGAAGSAGAGGTAGTAGVGGSGGSVVLPDPNDHPDILRPVNDMLLTPTRAYLLWQPGALQDASQIMSYQVCYTTEGRDTIDEDSECPNSKSVIETFDVIDLGANFTYFVKVRAIKSDNSRSAFSALRTFSTDDSLVGWYKFDEDIGNGSQVTDSSGKGNHGVLVSDNTDATESGPGIIGQALILNGVNEYADLTTAINNLVIDSAGEYSVEARMRLDAYSDNQTVFGMFNSNGSQPGIRLSIENLGGEDRMRAVVQEGVELNEINGANIPLQAFHHSIMTYLGTASTAPKIDLLFDSVSAGAAPVFGLTFTGAAFDVVALGATTHSSLIQDPFHGAIDEVVIYKRALDPDIVDNNYRAAKILAGEIP